MAKTPTRNASGTLNDPASESDDRCKNLFIFIYQILKFFYLKLMIIHQKIH